MSAEHSSQDDDKTGNALKAQRFRMLEDIADELAGEVVFPTHFDAVLRLRKVLHESDLPLASITAAIAVEPLISAKLLHLANSVAFNPAGHEVVDLQSAIARLGLNVVRSTAMSIVMTQLLRAKGMAGFSDLTQSLWEHSVRTAATARVIARRMTRINPEEAMLAGLIHDLGAFYMLYRATQYDELRQRPDSVKYLIIQWHESIGISLLNALGLPEEIVKATEDHDHLRPNPEPLRSLADIVYVANMLAGGHFEWTMQANPMAAPDQAALTDTYAGLQPEIEAQLADMRRSFA
ncbi:MAG: HDOD domain-containing protein [Bacteroidota bacterium]